MKKIIAFILSCSLVITGCSKQSSESIAVSSPNAVSDVSDIEALQAEVAITETTDSIVSEATTSSRVTDDEMEKYTFIENVPKFNDFSDPNLLQYMDDTIYSEIENLLGNDDYKVENVSSIYISDEYIEELSYNSQSNIYFGYTLEELDEKFQGKRYIFTTGKNGETTVQEFEGYDDTYEKALLNIAIGTGVILTCVTVSILTAGTGAPAAVTIIFSSAAKYAAITAASAGVISGAATGIIIGSETGNMTEALKGATLMGSEGFKWGAVVGAVAGAGKESFSLYKSATTIHTPREAELLALERYGGKEQVSFLNGEIVSSITKGATRPDIVRDNKGVLEAIEVKRYDLENNLDNLCTELNRQVTDRVNNLPIGSTQRIVLDFRGRGYSDSFIKTVIERIKQACNNVYYDIPIDILSY